MTVPAKGPCTSRLENLHSLSKSDQIHLLRSIALDIQRTFSSIGQHLNQGTLSSSSAEPIYDVARTICKQNIAQQQRLKEEIRRLRVQEHRTIKEYRKLHFSTRSLAQAYKVKVERLRDRARVLRMRLSYVTQERDILTRGLGRKHEGPGETTPEVEIFGHYEIADGNGDGDRRRDVELDFVV